MLNLSIKNFVNFSFKKQIKKLNFTKNTFINLFKY